MIGMQRRTIVALLVLALVMLIGAGAVVQAQTAAGSQQRTLRATTDMCSADFCVDWRVLAGGIGPMESESFRLKSTLGQTMAGLFSGDTFELQAGFWAGVERGGRAYIPAILR